MPKLTYTPDGSDTPKVWEFSFGRLLSPERIAIEKQTGMGWSAVQQGFFQNSGVVIHAVLWVLLKRDLSGLRAEEVLFCDDEIDFDLTDAEAADALKALRQQPHLNEDGAQALAELERRVGATTPASEDAEDDAPKED